MPRNDQQERQNTPAGTAMNKPDHQDRRLDLLGEDLHTVLIIGLLISGEAEQGPKDQRPEGNAHLLLGGEPTVEGPFQRRPVRACPSVTLSGIIDHG